MQKQTPTMRMVVHVSHMVYPGLDPLFKLSHFFSLSVQILGQYLKTGPFYFFRVF